MTRDALKSDADIFTHTLTQSHIDMCPSKSDASSFFSRFMSGRWLSAILEGVSTAQSLSWTLSCPIHCGSSFLPWFISGFSLGFLTAVLSLTFLVWHLGFVPFQSSHFHTPPSSGSPRVAPPASFRRSSRLSGYLHGPESSSR